jgi:hypothetical protein
MEPTQKTRGSSLDGWTSSIAKGESVMSLWVRGKEGKGGRSLYLLDVPFELAFLLVGLMIVLLILFVRRLF